MNSARAAHAFSAGIISRHCTFNKVSPRVLFGIELLGCSRNNDVYVNLSNAEVTFFQIRGRKDF